MLDHQKNVTVARIRERSFWISLISRALHHYGLSLEDSRLAGHLPADGQVPGDHVEQTCCSLLWAEAARLTEDDLLGMRLNRLFFPTSFGILALAAQASPTIGGALTQLTRFMPVVSSQVKLESRRSGELLILQLRPLGEAHPQHVEAILGYLARLLVQLDQRAEELLRGATLPIARSSRLAESARLLGCQRVDAADAYTLELDASMLDTPLATADPFVLPRLVDTLQDLLSSLPSDNLVEQVRRRIQLLIGSGDISEDRIAGPLNISPRHLRRKLSQEGTSYEQLVDEVRRESAIRLISEGQLSLTSIAYELGFLDPSSFTRAFRRWTDMSPTAFRRQVKAAD